MSLINLKEKSLTGAFWATVENVGTSLIGLGLFVVLARLLNPEAFGLLELAYSLVAFLHLLDLFKFDKLIIQRDDLSEEKLDTIFWINLLESTCLFLLALLLARPTAWFYGQPELENIIFALAFIFPVSAMGNVFKTLLNREFAFRFFSFVKITSQTLAGILAIYLALNDYGVWSLIIFRISQQILDVLILWTVCPWKPNFQCNPQTLSDDISFIFNVSFSGILSTIRNRGFVLILGYFVGNATLGYFSIAQKIKQSVLSVASSGIERIALPAFSRLQNDLDELRRVFYKGLKMTEYLLFPFYVGIILTAPYAIPVFFGDKWMASVLMLQLLTLPSLLRPIGILTNEIFVTLDRTDVQLKLSIFATVANLSVTVLLAPLGINVVLFSLILINLLGLTPLQLYYSRNVLSVNLVRTLKDFFRVNLHTIVMTSCWILTEVYFSYLGPGMDAYKLTMTFLVLSLVYPLSIYLFHQDDYKYLKSVILEAVPTG